MAREADRSPDSEHRHQQTAARAPLAPSDALDIQRTAGNKALVQLLRQAGHPWAQEQHQHTAGCGHQQNARAGQPAVQRSAVHDVLRTSGRPLDDATRTDMESRLGADFSDVRVHDDSAARASAAEVGARAYTSGNHVVIGEGGGDRHTLAHELTHVIQQRRGPVAGTDNGSGLKISDPSDRYEREAETNATRVLRSALPEVTHAPAAEREQRAVTGGAAVQRVIGENNSTAGVAHAQGEHVFNDVATLVNEFREAAKAQGAALVAWRNGAGQVHGSEKLKRIYAKLVAAKTQLDLLSTEFATTLDTHRRHHHYGTVNSGLGDDANAEVYGLYKRHILALLNDCGPDRLFLENAAPRSLAELESARDASIVDMVALGHVRNRFGAAAVNGGWYTAAKADMDRAFTAVFAALRSMLEIKGILAEED
ncbi:eCIS core domain-containing protein [Streptomyces cinereoruber]|uniref:eCIS core domain-containing protein n=1 Tax=Streptomyces cinereoruber TaxID=67260 RepID=UPI00363B8D51